MNTPSPPVKPDFTQSPTEQELREDLAAAYRLLAMYGMTDLVLTHLSVRLPGDGHRFLINPYGLLFEEITASCLVVVDAAGEPIQETSWPVNPSGFVVHSAVHMGRPEVACVLHTHTLEGMAIAAQEDGLLPIHQSMTELNGRVAHHEFEGLAGEDNLSERDRLVNDLGDKPCMIMNNHGLLTVGRTVAEAFYWMWYLNQACRIQLTAQSSGVPLRLLSQEAVQRTQAQYSTDISKGWLPWQALKRKLDREQPDYRH